MGLIPILINEIFKLCSLKTDYYQKNVKNYGVWLSKKNYSKLNDLIGKLQN